MQKTKIFTHTGKAVSLSTADLVLEQIDSRKTLAECLCCSCYYIQSQMVLTVYSKYSHYIDYDNFKFFLFEYAHFFFKY